MRLSLLALTLAAVYEYDKRQVRNGKESMFADLGKLVRNVVNSNYTNYSDHKKR